jgi:uncharacterized repeat protein (TIGR01451 family)
MRALVGFVATALLLSAATSAAAQSADLSITKTNGTTSTTQGANTTYTIAVTNNGPNVVDATITDTLPAALTYVSDFEGIWDCTTPAVGASGTITCTTNALALASTAYVHITVKLSPTATGSVSNTAVVTSPASDANPANNSATDSDSIILAATPTPVPTLGEWALILFGLMLAGGAALHLSRRRLAA